MFVNTCASLFFIFSPLKLYWIISNNQFLETVIILRFATRVSGQLAPDLQTTRPQYENTYVTLEKYIFMLIK